MYHVLSTDNCNSCVAVVNGRVVWVPWSAICPSAGNQEERLLSNDTCYWRWTPEGYLTNMLHVDRVLCCDGTDKTSLNRSLCMRAIDIDACKWRSVTVSKHAEQPKHCEIQHQEPPQEPPSEQLADSSETYVTLQCSHCQRIICPSSRSNWRPVRWSSASDMTGFTESFNPDVLAIDQTEGTHEIDPLLHVDPLLPIFTYSSTIPAKPHVYQLVAFSPLYGITDRGSHPHHPVYWALEWQTATAPSKDRLPLPFGPPHRRQGHKRLIDEHPFDRKDLPTHRDESKIVPVATRRPSIPSKSLATEATLPRATDVDWSLPCFGRSASALHGLFADVRYLPDRGRLCATKEGAYWAWNTITNKMQPVSVLTDESQAPHLYAEWIYRPEHNELQSKRSPHYFLVLDVLQPLEIRRARATTYDGSQRPKHQWWIPYPYRLAAEPQADEPPAFDTMISAYSFRSKSWLVPDARNSVHPFRFDSAMPAPLTVHQWKTMCEWSSASTPDMYAIALVPFPFPFPLPLPLPLPFPLPSRTPSSPATPVLPLLEQSSAPSSIKPSQPPPPNTPIAATLSSTSNDHTVPPNGLQRPVHEQESASLFYSMVERCKEQCHDRPDLIIVLCVISALLVAVLFVWVVQTHYRPHRGVRPSSPPVHTTASH
jgi:hypothetical protein